MDRFLLRKALALLLCLSMCLGITPAAFAWDFEEFVGEEAVYSEPLLIEEELVYDAPEAADESVGEYAASEEYGAEAPALIPVRFLPEPAGAAVTVRGTDEWGLPAVIWPEADGTYLLAPGEYLADVRCEGYAPLEQIPLSVADQPLEIPVVMTPVSEPEQIIEAEQPGDPEQILEPEQVDEAEQVDAPEQVLELEQADEPAQPDAPELILEPEQADEPAQIGEPEPADLAATVIDGETDAPSAESSADDAEETAAPVAEEEVMLAAQSGTSGNFSWTLDDSGKLTISGSGDMEYFYCSAGSSQIKSIVIGDGITSIGMSLFSSMVLLESVSIPSSVKKIGMQAFENCSRLERVVLRKGLETIEAGAFSGCRMLSDVSLPTGLRSLGGVAFSGCSSLTAMTIPNSVLSLGNAVFTGCTALKTVTLPKNSYVKEIPESMFFGCSGLTGITIPSGMTQIGKEAFYNCSALSSVSIPSSVTYIQERAFANCGSLAGVTLPDGLMSIGMSAFEGCSSLQKITIPICMQSISMSAFNGCSRLSSVTLPLGLMSIGGHVFADCVSLKSITIPDTVEEVGDYAFAGSGLVKITVPGSVKVISKGMFSLCQRLTTAVLSDGVERIGESAFASCGALMNVSIPSSVYRIGQKAFSYCTAMEGIAIPEGVTTLDMYCFEGCSSLQGITLPKTMGKVDMGAFNYCSGLTSAWLPDDLTDFGTAVFSDCRALTSVKLPAKMLVIPEDMFHDCTSLPSIRIPSSVWAINERAFAGCAVLKYVVLPLSISTIEENAFSMCKSLTDVYYAGTQTQWGNVLVYWEGNEAVHSAVMHYSSTGPTQVAKPAVTKQPTSVTALAGNTVTFIVRATGDGLSYLWQWRKNSSGTWASVTAPDIGGARSAALSVPVTTARNGYQYRCKISNSAGTVYSNAVTLTVKAQTAKPTITTQPTGKTVSAGGKATFSVGASGSGLSYQWQWRKNSSGTWASVTASDISGAKTASMSVPATTARNGYQYRCKVSNSAGSAYSVAATLTVKTSVAKPTITTQPQNKSADAGSTATFKVVASGSGLSYQWQWRKNSSGTWASVTASDISGAKTTAMSVPATSSRNGYQYRCKVSNSGGTAYSGFATLTVRTSTAKPSITAQPASKTVSAGSKAAFKVTASGSSLSYQWQWRKNSSGTWDSVTASDISGAKTAALNVPATSSRSGYQYRCKVSNSAGTVYSNAATLTVRTKPTVTTQPSSKTVSAGNTAVFKIAATGGGLRYQWQWRKNSSGTWDDSTFSGAKTAALNVPATAARNGYQYRCKVSNIAGTVYSNAATLTVSGVKPNITSQPTSKTVSVGGTATFKVAAAGTGLSYRWEYSTPMKMLAAGGSPWSALTGDSNCTGISSATLKLSNLQQSSNNMYLRCAVTNSAGTVYSSTATLTVK